MAVSMGYNAGNGHVNYLEDWGTPKIEGIEISSLDLARCHMNGHENSASSSAWNNDRIQRFPIDTERMDKGLSSILASLEEAGKEDAAKEITLLRDRARAVSNSSAWGASKREEIRAISSAVMDWFQNHLSLDKEEINEENVAIMPSNTERDDSLSDNSTDRERVGGGMIGDQELGSANATDGSYFVPLECLAAGWNGKEKQATGYAGFSSADQFVMLSSIEAMHQ